MLLQVQFSNYKLDIKVTISSPPTCPLTSQSTKIMFWYRPKGRDIVAILNSSSLNVTDVGGIDVSPPTNQAFDDSILYQFSYARIRSCCMWLLMQHHEAPCFTIPVTWMQGPRAPLLNHYDIYPFQSRSQYDFIDLQCWWSSKTWYNE